MSTNFSYSALIISESQEIIQNCDNISNSLDVAFTKTTSMIDALEHLMDFTVDIIFLDLSIAKEEASRFLEHISSDYENKFTPVVVLTDIEDCDNLSQKLSKFNIISIMYKKDWNLQALRLLTFLRITKLNLHVIQDSLIESEDRGTMDQLTGAYNRYGCEDIFHSLTSRSKAYDEPFSSIMIDIDHFKIVNDTHGHDIGDCVLQEFANILMSSIRRDDSLIRFGGEEFMIFLSNANKSIAVKSAEKIRLKIESASFSSKNLKITASFGVVQYQNQEDMNVLTKRVDELLYIAKDSGRNIVISKQ